MRISLGDFGCHLPQTTEFGLLGWLFVSISYLQHRERTEERRGLASFGAQGMSHNNNLRNNFLCIVN